MKTHIRLFLAAFTLITAMNAFSSCEKDNPISPVTPVEKPGQEDIYVSVEFQPVVLGGERGSVATASYTVKTNLDSNEEFVLSLKENPYFKLEGKTVTALRKNVSEKDRTDTLLLTHPKLPQFAYKMPLAQKSLPRPENLVDFKCEALKAALVERFDTDYDGEISTDEALAVEEIDIRNCGITDLTGIGAFKKAWKLDARDNDIVDGTDIKGMRQLYWLDLKGNKNLATFDITGCTIYFEWFDFEVTENLKYYLLKNQVQKEELTVLKEAQDRAARIHKHIADTRETNDWTGHNEITLVKKHTTGEGIPFVVTGMGFIDADVQDGSMTRLLKDAVELMYDAAEEKSFVEQFDFYICTYIRPKRNEWPVWMVSQEVGEVYIANWWVVFHEHFAYLREKLLPGKDNIPMLYYTCNLVNLFGGTSFTTPYNPDFIKDEPTLFADLPIEMKRLGAIHSSTLARCSSSDNEKHFADAGIIDLRDDCTFGIKCARDYWNNYVVPYLL